MIQQDQIIIRRILPGDLHAVMRLSTEQGWNQTEKDWQLIIANPPNRCLLAEYHGKIIGTTAAMNYNNDVAWINMVLVDKDYRGHGISKSLLKNIFAELIFLPQFASSFFIRFFKNKGPKEFINLTFL